MRKGAAKDLTGQRFGRLVVVSETQERSDRCVVWKCLCDCGNEHYVVSRSLVSGRTRSCGCLMNETRGVARTTHHMSDTKLYYRWQAIKKRCNCENHKNYSDYGGRGISVCDEWMNSPSRRRTRSFPSAQ